MSIIPRSVFKTKAKTEHKSLKVFSSRFLTDCIDYFSEDEIMELMDVYNSYNISEITIHARIGKQLYSGDVQKHQMARRWAGL